MAYHYGHGRGHIGLTLGFFGLLAGAAYFLIDLHVIPLAIAVEPRMLAIFFAGLTILLSLILIGHGMGRERY